MPKVNAIVEARMGSKRLPGKTLMPIMGRPAIELLLERLTYAKKVNDIIVATTTNPEDNEIDRFCIDKGYKCFRGDSEDVLNRVYSAAVKHDTDVIVEVTGDCPLLDPWLIDECIGLFLNSDYDYLSNFIEQSYPPGVDVQIFTFKALEEMNRLAKAQKFREHVTLYVLKNPDKYKMYNVKAPREFFYPDWHLELDEAKDYELIKKIYEALYKDNPAFTTGDIIRLLKSNPGWLKINEDVKRSWENVRKEEIV